MRPQDKLPACANNDFAKYMRIMEATLKAKDGDVVTGKIRLRAYHSRLGYHSVMAIKFMVQRCVDTMIFFPTICECLEIIKEWENPLDRPMIRALCINLRQDTYRFEDFRETLRTGTATQAQVDAITDRWKRIFTEQGYLRLDPEAKTYTIRERKSDDA